MFSTCWTWVTEAKATQLRTAAEQGRSPGLARMRFLLQGPLPVASVTGAHGGSASLDVSHRHPRCSPRWGHRWPRTGTAGPLGLTDMTDSSRAPPKGPDAMFGIS